MSTSAPAPVYPRRLRGAVLGCLLGALFVVHVVVRYLFGTLFGYVEYRGLAPVVPFVLLAGYGLLLAALAVGAVRLWGFGSVGMPVGLGALLLALEPGSSAFLWGDGCEVAGRAGGSLLPKVTGDGVAVVLHAWNGACAVSLNTAHVGVGLLLVGSGVWAGGIPDVLLRRWLRMLDRDHPADAPK